MHQVRDTPLQNQHQVIINHTDQVQHITEVRVREVLREVTERLPLQQNQVTVPAVLLREVAGAAIEAVGAVAGVVVHHSPEVREAREVRGVRVAEAAVAVQDHLREEDN